MKYTFFLIVNVNKHIPIDYHLFRMNRCSEGL